MKIYTVFLGGLVLQQQQQYLLFIEGRPVLGGHFINIINNVNTSSIKTIINSVSFPSLHCPHIHVHVVEWLSYIGTWHSCCTWAYGMVVLLAGDP